MLGLDRGELDRYAAQEPRRVASGGTHHRAVPAGKAALEGTGLPVTLPAPRTDFGIGPLGRWGRDPLGLIEEDARLGPVFKLKLWRRTTLGHSPAWNRFVLGDLETFRSKRRPHREPRLWTDPLSFRSERFVGPIPSWAGITQGSWTLPTLSSRSRPNAAR
jgi:hypothetical protein